MPPPGSNQAVPLPVLETDGTILIVNIPHLSEQAFAFLKGLLDQYKAAIVKQPPSSKVEPDPQQPQADE